MSALLRLHFTAYISAEEGRSGLGDLQCPHTEFPALQCPHTEFPAIRDTRNKVNKVSSPDTYWNAELYYEISRRLYLLMSGVFPD